MSHLKVAVRVRPLSKRELSLKAIDVVEVENLQTLGVTNLKVPEQNAGDSRERIRRFTFDYCFNKDSTQDQIFDVIDEEISSAVKKRYHSCVLAYGQSATGKTHTMMGNLHDPGITPRLCNNIFNYLEDIIANNGENIDAKTCASYLEIYNEKVRDLLGETCNTKTLKVREHPKKGPYVQGLRQKTVKNSEDLLECLNYGNSNRRVAATNSNPQSSRSHSVFTISYLNGVKLHLIDLAGSERAGTKFPTSTTFREGANINKSLVALGNVISALVAGICTADRSSKYRNSRKRYIPYRDSILTWLLKDTLGGNSKTVMIATISPSNACYNETVNTLRFGQRAKQIESNPIVNEDPKETIIHELHNEIVRLKELLKISQGNVDSRCLCSCSIEESISNVSLRTRYDCNINDDINSVNISDKCDNNNLVAESNQISIRRTSETNNLFTNNIGCQTSNIIIEDLMNNPKVNGTDQLKNECLDVKIRLEADTDRTCVSNKENNDELYAKIDNGDFLLIPIKKVNVITQEPKRQKVLHSKLSQTDDFYEPDLDLDNLEKDIADIQDITNPYDLQSTEKNIQLKTKETREVEDKEESQATIRAEDISHSITLEPSELNDTKSTNIKEEEINAKSSHYKIQQLTDLNKVEEGPNGKWNFNEPEATNVKRNEVNFESKADDEEIFKSESLEEREGFINNKRLSIDHVLDGIKLNNKEVSETVKLDTPTLNDPVSGTKQIVNLPYYEEDEANPIKNEPAGNNTSSSINYANKLDTKTLLDDNSFNINQLEKTKINIATPERKEQSKSEAIKLNQLEETEGHKTQINKNKPKQRSITDVKEAKKHNVELNNILTVNKIKPEETQREVTLNKYSTEEDQKPKQTIKNTDDIVLRNKEVNKLKLAKLQDKTLNKVEVGKLTKLDNKQRIKLPPSEDRIKTKPIKIDSVKSTKIDIKENNKQQDKPQTLKLEVKKPNKTEVKVTKKVKHKDTEKDTTKSNIDEINKPKAIKSDKETSTIIDATLGDVNLIRDDIEVDREDVVNKDEELNETIGNVLKETNKPDGKELNIFDAKCKEILWNTIDEKNFNLECIVTNFVHDILQSKTYDNASQLINYPTNVKDFKVENKSIESDNIPLKKEEFIPVMEVTSNVKLPKPKPPLRRTLSVEGKKMERKNSRIFGSQELKSTSNEKLKNVDLKKIPEQQSLDVTQVEARVNSIRKDPTTKSRTDLIQEVTQRLYMKIKKKDASTDTFDLNKNDRGNKLVANKEMKTLASLKLKEFTKRAITAYKKRNKETQTYELPIRLKEISTDSYDLPFALNEVKSVSAYTDNIETKDASTSSIFTEPLYSIEQVEAMKNLLNIQQQQQQQQQQQNKHEDYCKLNRPIRLLPNETINSNKGDNVGEISSTSSSCNDAENSKVIDEGVKQNTQPLSFTKYLLPQQYAPHLEIANPLNSSPIYTSTVNINVSHNYINSNKPSDLSRTKSDSCYENVLFPTPDLISNHNSVDAKNDVNSPTLPTNNNNVNNDDNDTDDKVRYASTKVCEEKFNLPENLTSQLKTDCCFANLYFQPNHQEKNLNVDVTNTFAPEMCVLKEFVPDYCKPLKSNLPTGERPNIVEYRGDICEFSIKLKEPLLLKSIMKQTDLDNNDNGSDSTDSTQYEINVDVNNATNKKVHFPSKENNDNKRMFNAMTNFMKEANDLMTHLNSTANNLESKTQDRTYELQINVHDVPKFVIPRKGRKKKVRSKSNDNNARKILHDTGTNYDEMDLYANKYNSLVLDSCDRLERRMQSIEQLKEKRTNYDDSYLHRFPQPFSINADTWHHHRQQQQQSNVHQSFNHHPQQQQQQVQEYSSLESNPTHSDYGSLPRRRRNNNNSRTGTSRSPSAYLRHLTNLRQQIVETSREELLNVNQLNI